MTKPGTLLLILFATSLGCADDEPAALPQCDLGVVPTDATVIAHPAGCAPAAALPAYVTIAAALSAAGSDGLVYVAPGEWTETVEVTGTASLVGAGPGVTILAPVGGPGLSVGGAATLSVADLTITGAAGAGLLVAAGGTATATRVHIEASSPAPTFGSTLTVVHVGQPGSGNGVEAAPGATVTLKDCVVTDSAASGVLADTPAGLQIVGTTARDNEQGGIAIIDGTFVAPAVPAPVQIHNSTIEGNTVAGLAVMGGGSVDVFGSTISNTAAEDGIGDGVVVVATAASPARLKLDAATVVAGSARAGVLLSGDIGAADIIDGTFLEADVAARVEGNGASGVWAQGGGVAASLGADARLKANHFYGAIATAFAVLHVEGAHVEGTLAGSWQGEDIGDGLAVLAGAGLEVSAANIEDSARAGIFADAPSGTTFIIDGTFISGGEYGLVVQDRPADATWTTPAADGDVLTVEGSAQAAVAEDTQLGKRAVLCEAATCLPE